jgi:hypothetical protein
MEIKEVIGLLHDSEPVLKHPERVTGNILYAIQQEPHVKVTPLLFIQRILAAASVALLLLFGYEQYLIVAKVSRLEVQLSKAGPVPRCPDPLHMIPAAKLTSASFSASGINRLLSSRNVRAPFCFALIKNQLKTNPEK